MVCRIQGYLGIGSGNQSSDSGIQPSLHKEMANKIVEKPLQGFEHRDQPQSVFCMEYLTIRRMQFLLCNFAVEHYAINTTYAIGIAKNIEKCR